MRRHSRSIWSNVYLSFAAAVLLGGAIMLTGAAALSALSYYVLKTVQFTELFAGVSAVIGAFCAGYVCGRYRRRRGLIDGVICGALLYASLSAAGMIAAGAPAETKKLLLLTVAGAAGGVMGVNTKRPSSLM